MANFTVKDPPEFSTEMRMLEPTDPAHANLLNPMIEQLLNNDVFLKAVANAAKEHMQNNEIHVTEQDKELWDAKAGTAEATQSEPGLMSAGDKKKLDGVAENAEVNQNAYSNIKVGSITISANGKTSTLTLEAGDNITISADNATKKIVIAADKNGGNADMVDGYHAEHFANADHGHDGRYYTKTESDNLLKQKAASSHSHTKASITDFPTSMTLTAHTHDDRYYTETEVNNLLANKAASSHSHSYLPLSGGTMTGVLKMSLGKKIEIDGRNTGGEVGLSINGYNNKVNFAINTMGSATKSVEGLLFDPDYGKGKNLSLYIGEHLDFTEAFGGIMSIYSDKYYLGGPGNRFKALYAVTGTIQTSDREKKKNIQEFNEDFVEAFIMGLTPVSYILKENESGRTHYGLIAQDVEDLMDKLEMDSKDFAGFIKSPRYKETIEEIEVENEVIGEDGEKKTVKEKRQNMKKELVENEYNYALRYEEFISPIIKMLQILNNKLDNRQEEIGKLKTEIEALKAR